MRSWLRVVAAVILLSGALGYAQEPRPQRPPPLPPMPGNGGDVYRDEIIAREKAGLEAMKTGDLAAFAAATADDALFVDGHGVASKAEVMKHLAGFRLKVYTMSEVRFVPVSADGGLVAYTLTETGTSQGKEFAAKVYVSAVWQRIAGRQWVCVFSQETAAK